MPIGGGGRTPDEFPGDRIEDAILILTGSQFPVDIGELSYVSGTGFAFMQDDGIALIRSGNFNPTDHETLSQLIHLAEGGGPFFGYDNCVKDSGPWPFITASVWWTDTTRTKKIVEKLIMRNPNSSPSTIQWVAYGHDGVSVVESMTDRILYSGAFEVSRSRSTP
jgi:hypothetical protein